MPLAVQDLFCRDGTSIPTAPTNLLSSQHVKPSLLFQSEHLFQLTASQCVPSSHAAIVELRERRPSRSFSHLRAVFEFAEIVPVKGLNNMLNLERAASGEAFFVSNRTKYGMEVLHMDTG